MRFSRSSTVVAVAVVTICISLSAAYAQYRHSAAYVNAERKFEWIDQNGHRPRPSAHPCVILAPEWNAYLNEGGVTLPDGVYNVRLTSRPAVIYGDAIVDFDRLTAGRNNGNPLLALFTGRHHVRVIAQASAANGLGTVRVQSVSFDGHDIPRFALEYFCNHYLRPRYGNAIGLDSSFRLHSRIDTAIVGMNEVTITQR